MHGWVGAVVGGVSTQLRPRRADQKLTIPNLWFQRRPHSGPGLEDTARISEVEPGQLLALCLDFVNQNFYTKPALHFLHEDLSNYVASEVCNVWGKHAPGQA